MMKTFGFVMLVLGIAGAGLYAGPESPSTAPATNPSTQPAKELTLDLTEDAGHVGDTPAASRPQDTHEPWPGSKLALPELAKDRANSVIVCQAAGNADVNIGDMTDTAVQDFRVLEVLAGTVEGKAVQLRYGCVQSLKERPLGAGDRAIWVVGPMVNGVGRGRKALGDTPENRKAVAAAWGVPVTTAPATTTAPR